jgi:hypothetical protein
MSEKKPKWTVLCNLVSPESAVWGGTSWEFFDTEDAAAICYKRHQKAWDGPTKRPYYDKCDREHLGNLQRYWLDKAHESGKR